MVCYLNTSIGLQYSVPKASLSANAAVFARAASLEIIAICLQRTVSGPRADLMSTNSVLVARYLSVCKAEIAKYRRMKGIIRCFETWSCQCVS